MRVLNVYDIDNKTYLIRLQQPESKKMILLESGNKIHSTEFEWPKNMMPSGFSMKLRKHLRSRRLESINQLGMDRIIDLQFGSNEAAYHVILELYDRGNIVLTDHEYLILNILRPRTDDSQDVRFAVREKYPVDAARPPEGVITSERLMSIILNGKEGDSLKKLLIPHLVYGPALIEHCLLGADIKPNAKLHKEFHPAEGMPQLLAALTEAERIIQLIGNEPSKGFITQKREQKASVGEGVEAEELLTYQEFHPMLYKQHEHMPYLEFDTFNKCIDEFFSKIGSQKLDMKVIQQEKQALKKLDNVKKDYEKRTTALQSEQDVDQVRAQLIEINLPLVDRAIMVVNSALANQVDWNDMMTIVKDAQAQGDTVAAAIKQLKLDTNHITLALKDPYDTEEQMKPLKVDIDLALSAYANARKYYDMKRGAAKKELKTVESLSKALKSAERKTKQTLKDVHTVASINKARKTYWFEKFLWFISSENYLVIGGRDQQQNELLVKRYFNQADLYVHADLHGASSVILKNPSGAPVPPKTLNEAGSMAICNSAAWDARVVTSAWWVTHSQVSKTAPSGEYLTTGSFMIRGKKNYLPPSYLIYGFGFLFKLDDESLERHVDERRVRTIDDDVASLVDSVQCSDVTSLSADGDESNVSIPDSSDGGDSLNTSFDQEEKGADDNGADDTNTDDSKVDGKVTGSKVKFQDKPEVKIESGAAGEDEESLFPDTSLALHHVKGGKFTLQREERSISVSSQQSHDDEADDSQLTAASQIEKPNRLTAKQRRDQKKRLKQTAGGAEPEAAEQSVAEAAAAPPPAADDSAPDDDADEPQAAIAQPEVQSKNSVENVPQPKRRQKAKLRKINEKYKDQDDEERQLRMEILASAGGPRTDTRKSKQKLSKQKRQQQSEREARAAHPQTHQPARPRQAKQLPPGRRTLQDITVTQVEGQEVEAAPGAVDGAEPELDSKADAENDGNASDGEKADDTNPDNSDASLLNSFTGQPLADDLLLFTIPVCAPYSALTNYKFKVKLMPGTAKRGKAAKAAVNMFQHDKATVSREKDLFRSLKDVDLSRNIPGKVKVSAPNLHKHKGK